MLPDAASNSRDAMIADLLASPPPRRVPPELLRAATREGPALVTILVGLFFIIGGSFLTVELFPIHVAEDWKLAQDDALTVPGRVDQVGPTNLRINHQRVMYYGFSFQLPAGNRMTGGCYTTGAAWRVGDTPAVRYRPENPAVCCLAGARRSQNNWATAFVVLLPLAGIWLVMLTIQGRRRMREVLRSGTVVQARVVGISLISHRGSSGQHVHTITLHAEGQAGGPPLCAKSSTPRVLAFARRQMELNETVYVLFHPKWPRSALLPEALLP